MKSLERKFALQMKNWTCDSNGGQVGVLKTVSWCKGSREEKRSWVQTKLRRKRTRNQSCNWRGDWVMRHALQRNATIPHSHQKTDGSGKWWAINGPTFWGQASLSVMRKTPPGDTRRFSLLIVRKKKKKNARSYQNWAMKREITILLHRLLLCAHIRKQAHFF